MTIDYRIAKRSTGRISIELPDQYLGVSLLLEGDIQGGPVDPWLETIDCVLNGESEYDEITGNSCTMEVSKDCTKIIGEYLEGDNEFTIPTLEMRRLIVAWEEANRKYYSSEGLDQFEE